MNQTTTISKKAKRFSLPTKKSLTTPKLLNAGLYLTWGASFLLAIATISGIQAQRNAIKTIGKDSVPSILTAQRLKDSVAGMDANAVNELLIQPGKTPGEIQDYQKNKENAMKGYEERRKAFSERIVLAAQNITYGDAELKPIQTLQLVLGDYIAKIQRARDLNERGDINGALIVYREAAQLVDNTLLPAADALDKANTKQLEEIYRGQGIAAVGWLLLIFVSGTLLIAGLVTIQIFLNNRMRRILNPMLLAATAIALLFVGHTMQSLSSASYNLKVAKEDAFDSLHALRQSRALAYGANADESRYLLDKQNAAKHEQAFFAKVNQIVKLPQGKSWDEARKTLVEGKPLDGLTGFFADEINNITFSGEREAMIGAISTFGTYFDIDKQIRQLEQSGKHLEAVKLCTGIDKGESNWAFDEFKKAHTKVQDINQKEFDKAIAQGFKNVENFEITTIVVVLTISGLTLFGLRSRINEYGNG